MRRMRYRAFFYIVFISLFTRGVTIKGIAQEITDSLKVYPSMHGLELGATERTLFAIQFPRPFPEGRVEVKISIPEKAKALISNIQVLGTDLVMPRDLPDYKGRVGYTQIGFNSQGDSVFVFDGVALSRQNAVAYIVADVASSEVYDPSYKVEAKLESVTVEGRQRPLKSLNGKGLLTQRQVYRKYKSLFVPGDTGSRFFRIPALLKTKAGTLIAVADRRKYSNIDLPEDIDIIMRKSMDDGSTWSSPKILIKGKGFRHGYGDAALVQTPGGKIIMLFVGGPGLWNSTDSTPQPTYMMTSEDEGETWSKPEDITHYIYGKDCLDPERKTYQAAFCASGHGMVTSSGRIMFVTAIRRNREFKLDNYLLYSDDEGKSWHLSEMACKEGDEAKVIPIKESEILMSIRNPKRGDRYFRLSKDEGLTWQQLPQNKYDGLNDPACNAALLQVVYKGMPLLVHTAPRGPKTRRDGAIYIYNDKTNKWSHPIIINPGLSAYSDLISLDGQTLGYFVEEDDPHMTLSFISFTLDDLFYFYQAQKPMDLKEGK